MSKPNKIDIYAKEPNNLTAELLEISEKLESLIREHSQLKSEKQRLYDETKAIRISRKELTSLIEARINAKDEILKEIRYNPSSIGETSKGLYEEIYYLIQSKQQVGKEFIDLNNEILSKNSDSAGDLNEKMEQLGQEIETIGNNLKAILEDV